MSKNEKRKTGELLRTLGDFGLGMFGAAATGVTTFSHARRRQKTSKDPEDFVSNAAEAVEAMLREASQVAAQTQGELRISEASAAPHAASGFVNREPRLNKEQPGPHAVPHIVTPEATDDSVLGDV